jgi:ferredoxin
MRKAANDIKRCVACGVCALQCPRQAIDIYKGCYAVVDESVCVGCGICASACPAGSMTIKEYESSRNAGSMTIKEYESDCNKGPGKITGVEDTEK